MEAEFLHFVQCARCLITIGNEVLKFSIMTCLRKYHIVFLNKTDFCDQSNDVIALWNTFDQQYKAVDASSQQILASVLAEWKSSFMPTHMEIMIQPSDRKDWEDDVQNCMGNHASHQDTSKKCSGEIQNFQSLILGLLRLTERHHDDANNFSAVFLNKPEWYTRMYSKALHTVLKSFQEEEINTDQDIQNEYQTSSILGRPNIELLLDHWFTPILGSLCHDTLYDRVILVSNILQRTHQTCPNIKNFLRGKHQTCQIKLTNTCRTYLRKMSECGNKVQQIRAFADETQTLATTRQYFQACLLASNRQIQDWLYSERRDGLKMTSGQITTDLQLSTSYQFHGYIDLGMRDTILLSTMGICVFPVHPLKLGWTDQILETHNLTGRYLLRPKLLRINILSHIPVPTLSCNESEERRIFFDGCLHGRSKAFHGLFELYISQNTEKLKTCPSDFHEDITVKFELIRLNRDDDIQDIEQSTDAKVIICVSHVQTRNEKVQKLHQYEIFKKLICQITEISSQPKRNHFTTNMCIESAVLPMFRSTEKGHGAESPKRWYVNRYLCNTNLSEILYLSRASYAREQCLMNVIQASLSLRTVLHSLTRSYAYIGDRKQDLAGLCNRAELCNENLETQSKGRLCTLNEYLHESWIQYCTKLQMIAYYYLRLPCTYVLQNLNFNDMTLYDVYKCLTQRASVKEPALSDSKLKRSVTSRQLVGQSYSTILLERIRDAKRKCNSCFLCSPVQWLCDFYFNYAKEEEQFDSAGDDNDGRNIYAAYIYVPNSKPENEMVQIIDHHALIHGGNAKSNPSTTDVKPQLLPDKACYHTPIQVTDDPSDYISLSCRKRPANVSYRVKDDLVEVLSPIYKMTKGQCLVKLGENVKLHSSSRESDFSRFVKDFLAIFDKIHHARSIGSKTSLCMISEPDLENKSEKEVFEAITNDKNLNDIDLQDKKKHYLQRLTTIPLERLPQPVLNRDAVVYFVEEHTPNTFGRSSSSDPPFDHGELREMLNQLASDNVPGPHITMKYEMLRLCTMKTFPAGNRPFSVRIVRAGFYYAGHRDQVVCYCCGSRKDNWVLGDIPLFIHQTLFPSCSFLTSNATVNVPIIKANPARSLADVHLTEVQRSNGSNQLDTTQCESSLMIISSHQKQENDSSRNHEMLVTNKGSPAHQLMSSGGTNVLDCGQTAAPRMHSIDVPPPRYPQYSSKNMRINSFQGWPAAIRHTPEEMAECGFYYAGFDDCVRCFHCGVGLRKWINEDDPWIEHARWSTSCIFVLKMKGEEFVSLIKMAVEIAEKEEESYYNGADNQSHQNNTATGRIDTGKKDCHSSGSANSIAPADVTSTTGTTDGAVGGIDKPISSPGNADIQKYLLTDAARSVLAIGYELELVLRAIKMVLMKKGQS
ncbi:hypothetical protein ACJMK2_028450 [Sinanodonta woodiana]|uniref:Uncharacterized protein n=1 Tax=Sinanodonta woodiana TaxID=1069815 RepID=A0ABD3X763_SINWO